MTTAVDTSILLDVFIPDPLFGVSSRRLIEDCFSQGPLIISPEVYAELLPHFRDTSPLDEALLSLGIQVVPTDLRVAEQAGHAWLGYRQAGGSRSRILTDFMIAAHALVHADCLATRDQGFYRRHFPALRVRAPDET